jgi:hypothetical protein
MSITVEIGDEDAQIIALALAKLVVERPGWAPAIDGLARRLAAHQLLVSFLRLEDRFVCPRCCAVSHNPNDVAHRYCGRCKRFVDDPRPQPPEVES